MMFNPRVARQKNLRTLEAAGFAVAPSLPLSDESPQLRPIDEIAGRLAALNACFVFLASPPERFATRQLLDHIRENKLDEHLTAKERSLIELDRAEASAQAGDAAGWRTENSLSLAWVLGGGLMPTIDGAMLDGEKIRSLVVTPSFGGKHEYAAWFDSLRMRPVEEVAAMEDLFYCCHNAARSAQVDLMKAKWWRPRSFKSVPKGFDPIRNGGVIHDRRHALTWALSSGVAWDETDLST